MASISHAENANNSELVFGDGLPLGHEVVTALGIQNRSLRAERVRDEITRLGIASRELFYSEDEEKKMSVQYINSMFRDETIFIPDGVVPEGTFGNAMLWLAGAKRDQLQEFCEWNVAWQAGHQASLDGVTPDLRADTMSRVDKLVGINYFPKYARPIMEQTVDNIDQLHAIDSFEAGGLGADGYFDRDNGKYRLAIKNLFDTPSYFSGISPNLNRTALHEYLHAAGYLNEAGFVEGVSSKINDIRDVTPRWLEEAFVAHSSQVAMHDKEDVQPELILPWERKSLPRFWHGSEGPYPREREFLHLLAKAGPKEVPIELLPQAFFESKRKDMIYPLSRVALQDKLQKNIEFFFPEWGDDAFSIVSQKYELTKSIHRPKLMDGWLKTMRNRLGIETVEEFEAPRTREVFVTIDKLATIK